MTLRGRTELGYTAAVVAASIMLPPQVPAKILHPRSSPAPQATNIMRANFERHRQAWTPSEIGKLRMLAGKGMSLKSIAKALTRSEESVKKRAKIDKLKIAKAR